MKFSITEDKLISVMFLYAKKNIPQVTEPFETKLKKLGRGNSGYGSSMHDYDYYVTRYYSNDGNIILEEHDDRNIHENTKWELTESLEGMYDFFGEESIEKFFLVVHGINLKNKGNKKYDWTFGLEQIN